MAWMNPLPIVPPGNSFTIFAPAAVALTTSVTVPHPGEYSMSFSTAYFAISGEKCGLTRNFAPAAFAKAAWSKFITVPAPTMIFLSSLNSSINSLMTSSAFGVENVISML